MAVIDIEPPAKGGKVVDHVKEPEEVAIGPSRWSRPGEALRITPAMALGVADHIWTIGELAEAAMADTTPQKKPRQNGAKG